MDLLLRREQRDDGWIASSITFVLYAQLDFTEEEAHQCERYDLYSRVAYNSEDFVRHLEAADKHREKAAEEADLGEIISNSFSALFYNVAGRLSLQLTVQNLCDGIHLESQELEEILHIEKCVRDAAAGIASYLDVALTFGGEEQLNEY